MGMFSKLFGAEKEKCHNHSQKNAVGVCILCKRHFCVDCLIEVFDYYCCGSENCKNLLEEKKKQAWRNVIASGARDLSDHIIYLIDGFSSEAGFKEKLSVAAIYVEMMFLCINLLMEIASQYLDEEEKFFFIGEIYVGIRDILTKKYSSLSTRIDIDEFKAYFDDTFKERRMEYLNFVGLNPPGSSWSEDLLLMSFSKNIANILGKDVDLETDVDIQNLCIAASLPIMLVKQHLEKLKVMKDKYL